VGRAYAPRTGMEKERRATEGIVGKTCTYEARLENTK